MEAHDMTDVDVLIVGEGPVGLMIALLLLQRGLHVRVLENAPKIYDLPRAIVMDDEVQRVFQNNGPSEGLDAITTARLRTVGSMDHERGCSPYPGGHLPLPCSRG